MDSIEFGRKINYTPMAISWGVGIVVGLLIGIFAQQWLMAVILGVTLIVVIALVFAKIFSDFYGYWEINDKGISSYNYQNFSVRVQSVLMPFSEDKQSFKFGDIKALTVIVGKEMNAPANILGGSFYAPKKIMFNLPTPYYMELKLKDGREVNLDLSADWDDSETIEYVLAVICTEAEIQPEILKQA